jgi:hypothetical protein
MTATERVSLRDVRLELTQHLSEDELAELAGIGLPTITIEPGQLELGALLAQHSAFGAAVLDGIAMNALQIGEQTGIQLLGPGDLLVAGSEFGASWLTQFELRTTAPLRVAMLGNELLAAAYRWPRVVRGLYICIGEQMQRLTAQLVICQLPRVDERVLAMMWLLAESWGHVTPGGVRLGLALTHETLGALVGARRPTITLALRKLSEDGALVHQDAGWLLLKHPPPPGQPAPTILPPGTGAVSLGHWASDAAPAPDPGAAYAELRDTVTRLRQEHRSNREQTHEQLKRVRAARVRMIAVRERIAQDAIRRRPPPSS